MKSLFAELLEKLNAKQTTFWTLKDFLMDIVNDACVAYVDVELSSQPSSKTVSQSEKKKPRSCDTLSVWNWRVLSERVHWRTGRHSLWPSMEPSDQRRPKSVEVRLECRSNRTRSRYTCSRCLQAQICVFHKLKCCTPRISRSIVLSYKQTQEILQGSTLWMWRDLGAGFNISKHWILVAQVTIQNH